MTNKDNMGVQEIKDWYKQKTGREIPAGWDNTVKDCLDLIVQDCYYVGYNDGKERSIKIKETNEEEHGEHTEESPGYTYSQMATLNIQLQGLINTNNESYFKLREECEYYKNKLMLIGNILKTQ